MPELIIAITNTEAAKVAHEVNRAYCRAIGDHTQVPWNDAPDWQKESAIKGIKFHRQNPHADAAYSHDNWMKEKLQNGWKYGVQKDENLKTHPCIVPFDKLPTEQQAKDHIFKAVANALANL